MLQKYPIISVNARSLLQFIDEFVRQWLTSQISITLFLKNTFIKTYWYMSNRMWLLNPCHSLGQILTKNNTQSIRNMTSNSCGQKNLYERLHILIKQHFMIFLVFQCHGGLHFFEHALSYKNLWKVCENSMCK